MRRMLILGCSKSNLEGLASCIFKFSPSQVVNVLQRPVKDPSLGPLVLNRGGLWPLGTDFGHHCVILLSVEINGVLSVICGAFG